ncbi:MAG: DUF5677 domain-containing protein [Planctomycetota bacterium]
MSLDDALFVTWKDDGREHLPLDPLLARHAAVRVAVANAIHGGHDLEPEMWPFVALQTFSYAFNIYKAIGMVLRELYHEAASAMVRQLWEVSLNLHWIECDPDRRVQDFCNFTTMEMRKTLVLAIERNAGRPDENRPSVDATILEDFDRAMARFQSRFQYRDRAGHKRRHDNFATSSIQTRSAELGDPWESEYRLVYRLTSMHAHGAPGAVLQQMFHAQSASREAKERDASALVALVSMKLLVRDLHLLVRQGVIPDSATADSAFDEPGSWWLWGGAPAC